MKDVRILKDRRVSGLAKSILLYALARQCEAPVRTIPQHFCEGQSAVRRAIGELQSAGYLHRSQQRVKGQSGRNVFGPAVYMFFDDPEECRRHSESVKFLGLSEYELIQRL